MRNNPTVDLGVCTPFQLLSKAEISNKGTVCVIGSMSREMGIVKAMVRRSSHPYLFLGTAADRDLVRSTLSPDWMQDAEEISDRLPEGNGMLFFFRPYNAYLELYRYMEMCGQDYFPVLHLGNGLQIGVEVLDLICAFPQSLILCEAVPESLRSNENRTMTPQEFLKRMKYLLVSSAGASAKDLIEVLPTYQHENVSRTTNYNVYGGSSIFHPLSGHRGHGFTIGKTRAMDYRKSVLEMDEMQRIFDRGAMLVYNAMRNGVYAVRIT